MAKGPRVTLQVVCDGCEQRTVTRKPHSEVYKGFDLVVFSCEALGIELGVGNRGAPVATPSRCPYRAEAVKAVIG